MKKLLSIVLVLMLVASLFAGCGKEEEKAASKENGSTESKKSTGTTESTKATEEKEEVTLQFWYTANESDPNDPYNVWNSKNVELFMEQNPHITIEKVIIGGAGGENYRTKLTSEASVGNMPDIFMTWLGNRLEPFVQMGAVMPLDDIISEDEALSTMVDRSVLSKAIFDGKLYALPKASDAEGLFYNRELFEKYDLELPKSLDDLVAVSKVFIENGIQPVAVGNSVSWVTSIPYSYILKDLDADIFNKMSEGTVSMDDPVFIEAAEQLKRLADEGVFGDNFNGIAPAESRAEFTEGRAAMFLQGTWNMGAIHKEMGANAGFIPMPTPNGNDNGYVLQLSPHGYAISESTEHKEETIAFFKFMMSEERLIALADEFSVILPWGSIEMEPIADNNMYNDVVNAFANYEDKFDLCTTYAQNGAVENELKVAIQAITAGADIQETFEKLEAYRQHNSN